MDESNCERTFKSIIPCIQMDENDSSANGFETIILFVNRSDVPSYRYHLYSLPCLETHKADNKTFHVLSVFRGD